MKESKTNKTCVYQVRCTKDDSERIEKRIAKSGMKRSDYMREALLAGDNGKKKDAQRDAQKYAQAAVKMQELLNHLEENGQLRGKTEERMADEIWELL